MVRKWGDSLKIFLQNEFDQLEQDDISWITNDMCEIDEDCKKLLDITYTMLKLGLEMDDKEKINKALIYYDTILDHMYDHMKNIKKIMIKIINIIAKKTYIINFIEGELTNSDLYWLDLLRTYLSTEFNQLSPDDILNFINDICEITNRCKELLDITQNVLNHALEIDNKTDVIKSLKLYNIKLNHMKEYVKNTKKIINKMMKIIENENNIKEKIESLIKGPLQDHLDKLAGRVPKNEP